MKTKKVKKQNSIQETKTIALWRPEQTSNVPAVQDTLQVYLAEISKYPMLNKEEEEIEVKKMLDGDVEAAKKLVKFY